VVDDAPQADFAMSAHAACGPEVELRLEVKEENYDDHHLRFEWILGNGTVTEALVPENPQLFYSTLEDTVYRLKFRVYNVCNETVKEDSLTVGSLPKANLLFENGERNCSPLNLKVLNLSTGSRNEYLWYMGDGTEPLKVFEPLNYVYVTDSARKVFEVSLVAKNQCGSDSLMQPLTVLAQSIRAFFDKPKEEICVGEQICFTNHTRDTARDIRYRYWDFGDEVRDTSWNACHVYRDSGVYQVLLFVDNGCSSDTTSKFLHVIGNPQLELLVEQEHCDRDTFHFAFETDQPLQWVQWTLGDDSTVFIPSFSYVYRESGSYPVTLEVVGENRADCRSEKKLVLTVHPRPVLHVVPLDTLACTPYLYEPQIEGIVDKIMWDYGDGTPETSAGEHWYVNETDTLQGYEVVLHAVSDKGCPEDYIGNVRVANLPHAEVEKRVTNGRPQKVELVNLSPEGYVDYIWVLPGDKVVHTIGNQYFEFMENGVHA
ncbi:MAG: PKD domain-containing protein, partial [Odoribacter sp.]|nr:PKD domain-containing protein [Odoribacter sp.]